MVKKEPTSTVDIGSFLIGIQLQMNAIPSGYYIVNRGHQSGR